MGNTLVLISKFAKATFLALITAPFIAILALNSMYKKKQNRNRSKIKSVRFCTETIEGIQNDRKNNSISNKEIIGIGKEIITNPSNVNSETQQGESVDTSQQEKIKEKEGIIDNINERKWILLQKRQENIKKNIASLSERMVNLSQRITSGNKIEISTSSRKEEISISPSKVEKSIMEFCSEMGLKSAKMIRVPSDYYSWELEKRRAKLNAASVHHLCKSIILENTLCIYPDCSHPENSRFYLLIVQYTSKIQSHKVFKFVRTLVKEAPKKNYHFAYANEKDSFLLTGFEHNAICPFGTNIPIPIILSHKITELKPSYFFLGGGEVELKLGLDVSEFLSVCKPYVADITMEG